MYLCMCECVFLNVLVFYSRK
uniref:Uncharacterized protein n=1 Tax=Anopheles quadriannulatus TaxID=34691 RepID=A0A182XT82_ANOQN